MNTLISTEVFDAWLDGLKDGLGRIKILKRLESAAKGNWGDMRPISESQGLSEMRIHYGPGYRVYCGQIGRTVYLLVAGGSKRTQDSDINAAKTAWRQIKEEQRDRQKD